MRRGWPCLVMLALLAVRADAQNAVDRLPPPRKIPEVAPPSAPPPSLEVPPTLVPVPGTGEAFYVPSGTTAPDVVVPVDVPPEKPHAVFGAELLLWWVQDAPTSGPLAVVRDSAGNWQPAVGSRPTDFGVTSGLRLNLGVWFDEFNNYGIETNFFTLGHNVRRQYLTSDGNGSPAIALPYLSATPGQPGSYVLKLSEPGVFAGDLFSAVTLDLWGADVNGSICLLRAGGFEFTTLAGFRYLDLEEKRILSTSSTEVTTGDYLLLDDRFATRNEFFGGQLGARVQWTRGRLALAATAKVGLGATRQTVDVQGSSYLSGSGAYPGGFYAQASNIGRRSATQFSVVPAVDLKLSYNFYRTWNVYFGYDFLFWDGVVRPGDQIDHRVNVSQSPVFGNGQLAGPASPAPRFERSDFWVQGMTFGLEFRF